ncbi:MAG: glutamylcysteine synthetase [Lachnospiraceae bacterium]|nr:glutamylcysteine synthetase [Lachnospiraceae bacterium]
MNREELKKLLYEKYFVPIERDEGNYIGVEIEMPVVRLSGDATDYEVCKRAAGKFRQEFGFEPVGYDRFGECYSATEPDTGDNLSFDCSYNNMEFSFGREKTIFPLKERFERYILFLNRVLEEENHIVTGIGINPGHHVNRKDFLPVPRYQMLEGFLLRGRDWKYPMYMHPFYDFATYASASQVQLDVKSDRLIETVRAFSMVEPVKAVLFANSWMEEEPDLLCSRDLFWENSTHGINPHNIGAYEQIPETREEFLDYILRTSIFCTERDGHYLHFKPVPIVEYFERDTIEAEYYDRGVYHPYRFKPEESDLKYLRTYKFEDLTYRGTIEFRSCCNQPFYDAFCVVAFHLGLMDKTGPLLELLQNDYSIYHHGYSTAELRRILNRREWPEFIDRKGLRMLCHDTVELAEEGLKERGFGEEVFLSGLKERALTLVSPAREMVEALSAGKTVNDFVYRYSSLTP